MSDDEVVAPHRAEKMYSMRMPRINTSSDVGREDYSISPSIEKTPPRRRLPLRDQIRNLDTSFSVRLVQWIEIRGMTNVEAYKRANVDKKLFAKIYGNIHYQPKKTTALAFCIALKLSLEDTEDLIGRAGFRLSNASKTDIIVTDFILAQNYDIDDINIVLFEFDQPSLGSR